MTKMQVATISSLRFRSPDGRCTQVSSDDALNIRKLTSLGWVCLEPKAGAVQQLDSSPQVAAGGEAGGALTVRATSQEEAAATPQLAAAPSAGAATSDASPASEPERLLDILQTALAPLLDTRVDGHIARLRAIVREHRERRYIAPKFRKSPFGF